MRAVRGMFSRNKAAAARAPAPPESPPPQWAEEPVEESVPSTTDEVASSADDMAEPFEEEEVLEDSPEPSPAKLPPPPRPVVVVPQPRGGNVGHTTPRAAAAPPKAAAAPSSPGKENAAAAATGEPVEVRHDGHVLYTSTGAAGGGHLVSVQGKTRWIRSLDRPPLPQPKAKGGAWKPGKWREPLDNHCNDCTKNNANKQGLGGAKSKIRENKAEIAAWIKDGKPGGVGAIAKKLHRDMGAVEAFAAKLEKHERAKAAAGGNPLASFVSNSSSAAESARGGIKMSEWN